MKLRNAKSTAHIIQYVCEDDKSRDIFSFQPFRRGNLNLN